MTDSPTSATHRPRPRYAIIGAGAAGLAGLQHLRAQGFDVDVFEATDRVGGHWHTDYESLHLITSRDVSGFDGFPMPADYPVYPSRDQMRDYLEAFARHHDLLPDITFGTEVIRVTPVDGPVAGGRHGWIVTTTDDAARHTERTYDAVIVANGHLWDPFTPEVPGAFAGTSMHSSAYVNRNDITGERVLVVGAGNSGCDLAVDAANGGLTTAISMRRGQMFQPKALFGRPRSELRWLAKLPPVVQERLTRALVDIIIGPARAYAGLPEPRDRNLNHQPPVVNNLLPYWIQHGRIEVVPELARLDGTTVHFVDGTAREIDTILWATGFRVSFPFLDEDLLHWREGVPLRVGGMTVPVGLDRLFFLGLAAARGPQLPIYSAQSALIARYLRILEAGDVSLHDLHLRAGDTPDARIDILRPLWQRQMDRAHRVADRLERRHGEPPAHASSTMTSPTDAMVQR